MTEGVLGRALANLLAGARGRHYVQFPQELAAEARALAEAANHGALETRAVLVVEQREAGDPRWVVLSSQLIAWRTDADRVFVLLGGVVEPDSSFATSAGAFLTDAFPGTGGGACSPAQLAKATMEVALAASRPERKVTDAFALAGEWTIELLRRVLEDGAGSLEKLGARLLRTWAAMASDLEDAAAAASASAPPRAIVEADALEVFRLAGLPDPFGGTSWPALDESGKLLDEVADGWLSFVDRHLRLNEVNGVLAQLRQSSPIIGAERWTGLPWEETWRKSQRFSTTTPEIGRALFARGSPVFMPPGQTRRGDSWDAVSASDLIQAMTSLEHGGPQVSALQGGRFLPLGDTGAGAPLLVDVRAVTPVYRAARHSTMLRLDGHRLRISGLGQVAVDPDTICPGETLVVAICPKLVPATGMKILEAALSTAGGDLEVTFSFEMTIKEQPSKPVRWNSRRKLAITIEIQDDIGGTLQAGREVILSVPVVVPSPYWPCAIAVMPGRSGVLGQIAVSPGASVEFVLQHDGSLAPTESPELELDTAANARLAAYDGRWNTRLRSWSPPGIFFFSGTSTPLAPEGFDYLANARLLDQTTLQLHGDNPVDVTVVRIDSHAGILPTNTLRRHDRSVPLHEPRPEARETPFGRFQAGVATLLSLPEANPQKLESLYQLVVPSGTGELPADVLYARAPTVAPGAPLRWIGLGDGPSVDLATTDEWAEFTCVAADIARKGLENGVPDWLSSMDLSAVGAPLVRQYVEAHGRLVHRAESVTDKFWARYPFSVFLVDGSRGPERGSLQAIFLSPLHPARVAWLFSAQAHAESLGGGSRLLLGLADGWNIPAFGVAPGPGGSSETLVAVPLDPGVDGDNVPWSALVKTSGSGLVRPQLLAAGTRLPWGGRSGLNERVVAQALDDYLAAHPHASSLQIELRAAVPAPRSAEVDRAVVSWVDRKAFEVGGIIRVLDSEKRQGRAPSRDDLSERPDSPSIGRFTWQVRGEEDPLPGHVDIAFVENTAPFTRLVHGDSSAPTPALALRRFPTAVDEAGEHVDYQHGARGTDLLGLGGLLSVLEPPGATMRVVTTMDSLQADEAVRWEVIGDINLEPAQMARLAKAAAGPKQLWEWRPGWMSANEVEAVRGAHYVLARAPRSLVAGLRANSGLSKSQADELLGELGSRGIGLGTLRRPGSTQEGEAAGLFFAGRLLTGFAGCSLPPGWLGQNKYAGLIPLDPIHGIVDALGGKQENNSRADLALVVADCSGSLGVRLKVTPIECKHRGGLQGDGALPSPAEQRGAAEQVVASTTSLRAFVAAVSSASGEKELLQSSARLQTFATVVDLAMKFGPQEPEPRLRASILQNVVDGHFSIEVGNGVAVWSLKQAAAGQNGLTARRLESGVGHVEFIPAAAPALAWVGHEPDSRLRQDRAAFDVFCAENFLPAETDAHLLNLPSLLGAALFGGAGGSTGLPPVAPPGPVPRSQADGGTVTNQEPDAGAPAQEPTYPSGGAEDARSPLDGAVTSKGEQQPEPTAPADLAPPEPADAGEVPGSAGETGAEDHARADLFLGAETATRYTVIGKLATDGQIVALDLDHPKAIGVFGYMGSGKSYLLGALMEGAAMPIPAISAMRSPLAVVVFNYRRNAADRFELSSLVRPNAEPGDVRRLADEYGARPQAIAGLDVLCMPGELTPRRAEYAGTNARELYFDPRTLDVEDWELLMGEPGSDAVFARVIRSTLQDLRRQGGITVDGVREHLSEKLPKGSMAAAEIRLDAVERIVSASQGVDFAEILQSGRILAIDLRQPMFNRDDAMKLILVCANQIAKQRTTFNKLVVFDEAHEYMTEAFGERFDARIRYMRHEGSSYVFATQDVGSVPTSIRRHLGTNFVFSLETRDNIADIAKAAPEFANLQLQHLEPGFCYATSSRSTGNVFRSPRLISVRPRATAHGGQSRIFDGDA